MTTAPDKRLTQPPWWADLWRQLIAVAIAILLAVLFVGMLLTAIGGRTGEADVTMTPDEGMANASTPVAPSPTEENVAEDEPVADVPTPVAPSPTEESASDAEPIPRSTPFPTIIIADNSTKTPTIAHQPNDRKPISNTNVQEIVQLARFGKGQIEEIAYSPDGKLLAVATSLGVYIYDAETLEKVRLIEHDHFLFSAAFSPDGQFIAAGGSSDDAIIHIWNVSDGTKVMELVGHENKINNVLFSADEQTLASASDDGTVRLWNLADGTIRQILNGHDGGVTSLAFNATGDTLVSGSYDYTARVWQVENGTLLATLDGHSDWVRGVAVHPNGQLIATSSQDGTVNVWQDESVLYTLSDFSGRVESVAFSPDGKILATGSYFDKEISLWQAQDGELIETLEQAGVYDLIFSADGNTLATIFWGHSLELWRKPADQLQGFTSFNDLRDHTNGMTSVALTPDGQFVASGSYDQRVRVWDWQENQLLGKFSGHSGFIAEVAFSDFVREGAQVPYFVSGSQDQTVVVWNNGDVIDTLEGHEGVVNSVAFQKSGITVASGSSDNTVRLWRSDGLLHTFTEHTDEITSVIFNQSGEHVISGSEDKTVRIWKVEEGTLVNTLDGFDFAVTSVAEVNNEQFIAAGLDDGTIVLWRDGTRLGTLEGHQGRIDDMSFTADGTLLASGSYADRSIMLWDLEDGSLLHTLIGHNERVTGVMFNEDHTVLASSSDDGTIRLWGIEP